MVAFLRERAGAEEFGVETLCADMTTFSTEVKFAAAYNPMSSFRLLQSDAAAEGHLRRMAAALQPGGVYVLDMSFLSSGEEPTITTDESWEMMRGSVTVRAENDAVYVNDNGVEQLLAWGRKAHLRGYTAAAFGERVDAAVAVMTRRISLIQRGTESTLFSVTAHNIRVGKGERHDHQRTASRNHADGYNDYSAVVSPGERKRTVCELRRRLQQ